MRYLLLSTAIGDISGKPYESRRTRTKDYDSVDLLLPENTYSDDTVCTFACADALLNHKDMAQTLKEKECRQQAFWQSQKTNAYVWLQRQPCPHTTIPKALKVLSPQHWLFIIV